MAMFLDHRASGALVEVAGHAVEVAAVASGVRCGRVDLDAQEGGPFMVAASGCAPPMPPRPALTISRPAQRSAEMPATQAANVSYVP